MVDYKYMIISSASGLLARENIICWWTISPWE